MQNPSAVSDSSGEWFEVHNSSGADVNINGWIIEDNDSDSHVINNGGPLVVPAGGYLVLGNNDNSGTNGGVTVAYSYDNDMFLSNSSDELVLSRGDVDLGDGAGNCNLTRAAAAAALVDWRAPDPTGLGDSDVLSIGDLNAYDKEDPIVVITDAGYTDLVDAYGGEYAYSYVFDGQLGYLDHALSTPVMTSQVTSAAPWHINADEPDLLDYDTSFKQPAQQALYEDNGYRSSDHDPVVVGLALLHYDFSGFFPPIKNLPAINKVKAGSSVPVKFSLDGDYGLDIFFDGYPISREIDCQNYEPNGSEPTDTAGGSVLHYDADADQYVYVWQTVKDWDGTCRQLVIQLDDGSNHIANFRFK